MLAPVYTVGGAQSAGQQGFRSTQTPRAEPCATAGGSSAERNEALWRSIALHRALPRSITHLGYFFQPDVAQQLAIAQPLAHHRQPIFGLVQVCRRLRGCPRLLLLLLLLLPLRLLLLLLLLLLRLLARLLLGRAAGAAAAYAAACRRGRPAGSLRVRGWFCLL